MTFEDLGENAQPMVITQNEFMRRMKDLGQIQPGMNFYGNLPDNYSLVVNVSHPLVKQVVDSKDTELADDLKLWNKQLKEKEEEQEALNKLQEGKKPEEVPQEEKDKLQEVLNTKNAIETEKRERLSNFGKDNKLAKQLVDLALLANNMLKGEALDQFVKRSLELIK